MAFYLAEGFARVSQADRLSAADRRRRAAVRRPRMRTALARALTAVAGLLAPEEVRYVSEEVA